MAHIHFDRVTKQFGGGTIAVQNLCLEVADQEFLVLVGPSGCGKTTSLRMLAGLETITSGDLYINQIRVNDRPAKDRDIAMVFQSYALYPHMNVFENMAFSLRLQGQGRSQVQQRVTQVARQLDIERLLDRKPGQLSGGQRQRVALGRAMVRNPTVFLMDEPLSNLDAQLRVQARAELSKLHQSLGTTFIYVTHDQVEAMTMGTRIAVLNQGVLQQVDTPQTLYDFPKNRFVAGFLGSPPMNFLAARLQAGDDLSPWYAQGQGFRFPLPLPPNLESWQLGVDQDVLLGIRPESFYYPDYALPHRHSIPVQLTVSLVEHMGNELIVYGELGTALGQGPEVITRLDPRSPVVTGSTLSLLVDTDRFHLFDPIREDRFVLPNAMA